MAIERDDEDLFAETAFGRAALAKMGDVPADFRLCSAGWLGDPSEFTEMRVTGARFRALKSGPRAGQLLVPIKGTRRSVVVTKSEIDAQMQVDGAPLL